MIESWESLVIPRVIYQEMAREMFQEAPREICGALLMAENNPWYAQKWMSVVNVSPWPEGQYRMHPQGQVQVYQYAHANGMRVGALVHSHTLVNANLSRGDREMMAMQDTMYAVMSVKPREIRAWSDTGETALSLETRKTERVLTEHRVIIDHYKPGPDWCEGHGRYEDTTGCYLRCGECWHVFRTAEDLVEAHNSVVRAEIDDPLDEEFQQYMRGQLVSKPEQVPCCPVCTHEL